MVERREALERESMADDDLPFDDSAAKDADSGALEQWLIWIDEELEERIIQNRGSRLEA